MTDYSPKDIVYGNARICWGPSWHGSEVRYSWHLPGGGTTNSRDIAESVCAAMNELMSI